MSAEKKLRLAHVLVQPVFVYDDGEEMTPGPQIQATQFAPSQLSEFVDSLPNLVAEVEAKIAEQQAAQPAEDNVKPIRKKPTPARRH
jgi:hypothetical protein